MKNSDSKNSLAELNPPEPICFVCLEESSPDAPLIQSSLLRSCGCKFYTHAECWNKWRKEKSDQDCPYCGKRSMHLSLPMTAPFQQDYTTYHIEQQQLRNQRVCSCSYKKICFFVCFLCIAVPLIVAIILNR